MQQRACGFPAVWNSEIIRRTYIFPSTDWSLNNTLNFQCLLYIDGNARLTTVPLKLQIANFELSKIADWFKLILNASKTKFKLFRKKTKVLVGDSLKLFIKNKEIDRIGPGCKNESFDYIVMLHLGRSKFNK